MTRRGLPKILITAGPTREYIDPTRFISNPSSAKMGYLVAHEAKKRGLDVILISGPTLLKPPPVKIHRVISALEMHRAVKKYFRSCDVLVMSAAVSDFRPKTFSKKKIKKDRISLTLSLVRNPDILEWAGKNKKSRVLIGFAAETSAVLHHAALKLKKKNLDLMIANQVNRPGIGFEGEKLQYVMLENEKPSSPLRIAKKADVAKEIVRWILHKIHP